MLYIYTRRARARIVTIYVNVMRRITEISDFLRKINACANSVYQAFFSFAPPPERLGTRLDQHLQAMNDPCDIIQAAVDSITPNRYNG